MDCFLTQAGQPSESAEARALAFSTVHIMDGRAMWEFPNRGSEYKPQRVGLLF